VNQPFTHLNESGDARMVDVTAKAITERVAIARGRVTLAPHVVAALRDGTVPKGDALAVARLAAIQGTKKTADLIPLCHPIAIHGVDVEITLDDTGATIKVTVSTADRTGVEMEAMTAVSIGALALIDMVKGMDRSAAIESVELVEKRGGKSGTWTRT
jgi:cyclic pyranopterin phosphate synthase